MIYRWLSEAPCLDREAIFTFVPSQGRDEGSFLVMDPDFLYRSLIPDPESSRISILDPLIPEFIRTVPIPLLWSLTPADSDSWYLIPHPSSRPSYLVTTLSAPSPYGLYGNGADTRNNWVHSHLYEICSIWKTVHCIV